MLCFTHTRRQADATCSPPDLGFPLHPSCDVWQVTDILFLRLSSSPVALSQTGARWGTNTWKTSGLAPHHSSALTARTPCSTTLLHPALILQLPVVILGDKIASGHLLSCEFPARPLLKFSNSCTWDRDHGASCWLCWEKQRLWVVCYKPGL